MRILVVEDDNQLARYLAKALGETGHTVDIAADGDDGLALARDARHDLLIVDRMLPRRDGLALISTLRTEGLRTPVLVLSALGQVDDRVKGLKAGGDDYLTKPFAITELLARVEALLRRSQPDATETRYTVGDLVLDRLTRRVTRAGQAIALQPREFRLLEYLMKHAGQIVTRTMLLEGVWDYHFDPQTNVIDVHISRLRSKLDKGFDHPLLHTVRGAGYMIGDDPGVMPHAPAEPSAAGAKPATVKAAAAELSRSRALIAAALALARTMAFRLAIVYVAIFLVISALAGDLIYRRTSDALSNQLLDGLNAEADALVTLAAPGSTAQLIAFLDARVQQGAGHLYLLLDRGGAKLAGNLTRWPTELGAAGGTFRYVVSGVSANSQAHLAAGVIRATSTGEHLLVARSLDDQLAFVSEIRWFVIAGFGLLSVLGVAGALLASGYVRRRIAHMTAASDTIMAGDLSRRIPLSGSDDELDELATSFNAMLERIEQLMTGLREVSDNIAHDLRTPLGRLRAGAEAAMRSTYAEPKLREALGRVIEEADAMIKTFDALLLIARLEAGALDGKVEPVDLAALTSDVVELYAPVAEEAGLTLHCATPPSLWIEANRQLIGQAIANLVDNAIKYGRTTVASSTTSNRIDVTVQQNDAEARIIVADHGPGIPERDRERALKRFVRLDASRSMPGTGLGLSLVAAVAHLHRGSLALGDNAPGLRVELVIPTRPRTQAPGPLAQAKEPCPSTIKAPALSGNGSTA